MGTIVVFGTITDALFTATELAVITLTMGENWLDSFSPTIGTIKAWDVRFSLASLLTGCCFSGWFVSAVKTSVVCG